MSVLLSVEALDLYYGDAQALSGVSIEVPEGAITAIVVKIPAAAGGTAVGRPTGQIQNSVGTAFTLANGGAASFADDQMMAHHQARHLVRPTEDVDAIFVSARALGQFVF